ncbi:hypothetical protein [Dyella subtropica]|uniref:hypothetical protein n=1 Tax=Dyella subtropica TaxID=2992127 RepID=UPI00224E8B3D|nr:hypothetical protein [Dyella subtropica]
MSDVIEFLEKIGQDATLRHASPEDMELAMRDAQIDAPLSSAMLARDASELQTLLNLRPMFAFQADPVPGEEEEQPGKEEDPDEGDDTTPLEGRWTSSRSTIMSA